MGKVHAVCKVFIPSTSTTQMRQTPATQRSSCVHKVGICIWLSLQASRIVVPKGTETFFSFICIDTVPPIVVISSGFSTLKACWLTGTLDFSRLTIIASVYICMKNFIFKIFQYRDERIGA